MDLSKFFGDQELTDSSETQDSMDPASMTQSVQNVKTSKGHENEKARLVANALIMNAQKSVQWCIRWTER